MGIMAANEDSSLLSTAPIFPPVTREGPRAHLGQEPVGPGACSIATPSGSGQSIA